MAVRKSGLPVPLRGEHVKVLGSEIVYEVAGVDHVGRTVRLETVNVQGERLGHVRWDQLRSLDED